MRVLASLSAVVLLAGCEVTEVQVRPVAPSGAMIAKLKSTMDSGLRDPSSAQYRGFVAYAIGEGDTLLCGELNAKNGFGGYGGFKAISGVFDSSGSIETYHFDDAGRWPVAATDCDAAARGVMQRVL